MITMPSKQQWPECVGKTGEEAKQIVKNDFGTADIQIVKLGAPVTMDLRINRVRIIVDNNNKVVQVPCIG
jgi:hypothetical protein